LQHSDAAEAARAGHLRWEKIAVIFD